MKNTKTSKHALLSSIIAVLLSITMFIGTTFAWFTDSVTSGVNKIVAGNLDVEVKYSKNGSSWNDLEGAESLFSEDLWEPGHTEVVYLKVANVGTLALNYKVLVTPVSENGGVNVEGRSFKLSDYLVFGTTTPAVTHTTYTRDQARGAVANQETGLNVNSLTRTGTMVGKTGNNTVEQYMALVVYMPDDVGNEANYKTGTAAPTIELGIKVVATQLASEEDSFGPDYDDDAVNTPFYTAGAYYDYFEAVNVTATADGAGNFTVTKTDANTGIIASASGTATAGAEVSLLVQKSSEAEKNFTITVESGHELNGYDIKVSGQANGSLVQGQLYVGTGLENFKFYHNNTAMTLGTQSSLTNGQYYYNSTEGYVYFASTTFSPFQATYKAPVAAIGTAVYGTLVDAVSAVPDDKTATITLLKDSVGSGIEVVSARNVNVTIDFAGHTYTCADPAVGSFGTETQGFHLEKGNIFTFKNGTLNVADSVSNTKMLFQNYADLTLQDMVIDGSNLVGDAIVVSINCGTVNIIGKTSITAKASGYALDASWWPASYPDGAQVTLNTTGTVNGNISLGAYGNNGSITTPSNTKLTIKNVNLVGDIVKVDGDSWGDSYSTGLSDEELATLFAGMCEITGGKFSSDPGAYVPEGYGAIKEGNVYKVIAGSFAKSEAELNTLLATGGTVYLANDITLENKHTIPENATIDCLGYKVTVSNLDAFSGKNFTIKNGIFEKGRAWGLATGSCTLENCVFNGLSPYIVPSTGIDIVVKGCTFNDTMLQICWSEGEEKDPTKQTTTITGNTFNFTSTDAYNHVIALNAGAFINYSKVEVANNNFNNSGTPAFGAYYLSDSVDSKGCISINYHDNKETNVTVGYRDQAGTYKKVAEDNAIYAVYESGRKVLVKVTADYTGETFDIPSGVVAIGDFAFSSASVKKVTVPVSVTDLGRGFDSSNVEEVVLSEGLTTISSRAFRKTPNLRTLVIPSTVTKIDENAFQQSGITEIVIPESVISIEYAAFAYCPNLKTVTIQGNPIIANYAFRACAKLTDVYLNGTDVRFGDGISMVFSTQENNNNNSKITIHVVNETVKERVDAIKGKGIPYNVVLETK